MPGSGRIEPMTKSVQRTLLFLAITGLLAGLSACREEEQDRPLVEEKGVYQGETDDPLSPQQVEALRSRAAGQKF
jgi:hypothetical protein